MRHLEKKFAVFPLCGDPVQTPLRYPAPASCLSSTKMSSSEVSERGFVWVSKMIGWGWLVMEGGQKKKDGEQIT